MVVSPVQHPPAEPVEVGWPRSSQATSSPSSCTNVRLELSEGPVGVYSRALAQPTGVAPGWEFEEVRLRPGGCLVA